MINSFLSKIFNKVNFDFFSNAKNYLIAEILIKSLGLLTLPILSRLLEPSDYGILKIYESTVAFFIPLSGLALPVAIKRYFYDKKDDFKKYAGSIINFILLYNLILFIFIFFAQDIISTFLNLQANIVLIAFFIAMLGVYIRIYFDYLEASKQSKKYSTSKVIQGFSITIIGLIWIYFLDTNKYIGRIYTELFTATLFFIFIIFFLKKYIYSFNFKAIYIRSALLFSLPIIPGIISSFALTYFDTIIINQLVGSRETGLYSMAYQIGMIIQIINLSSLTAFQPIFFESMQKRNIEPLKQIMKTYSKFIYFCSALLILFSYEIGIILSPASYHEAFYIIPVIVLSYTVFFLYTVFFNYINFARKTIFSSFAIIIAGAVNIVLNYILIPYYGYVVAAFTTLISYGLQFLFIWVITHRIIKNKQLIISVKLIISDIYVVLFATGIFYILYFYSNNTYLNLGIKIVMIIPITLFLFRNAISKLLKK